jgi:copper resistance protein C
MQEDHGCCVPRDTAKFCGSGAATSLNRNAISEKPTMHRPILVVAMPLLFLCFFGQASAHAMLDHAEPGAGHKVATAPHEVKLWFTEKLEPAFSTIAVTNKAGRRLDSGKARVSGGLMSISLRPAGSGPYHVIWHAVSVDTHTTDGNFTFQVGL